MKPLLHRWYSSTLAFYLRAWTVIFLPFALLKAWPQLRSAENILFYPEGGFGHTLIAPDWLRRLYPGQRNVTLFGFGGERHNRWVSELWDGAFYWIPVTVRVPHFGVVGNLSWSLQLFRGVEWLLRRACPNARFIWWTGGLKALSTMPESVAVDNIFWRRIEAPYYQLVVSKPQPALHLPADLARRVEEAIAVKRPSGFSKSCNLFLRTKDGPEGSDMSSRRRNSNSFEEYIPAIRELVAHGFLVFITGDEVIPERFRAELSPAVLDCEDIPIEKDLYRLWVGLETDIHIGGFSGGSAFLYISDIPGLMLNAFPFGNALPFTTVHYKRLMDAQEHLIPAEVLVSEYLFDHDCKGMTIIESSSSEMAESVKQFMVHAAPRKPFGIPPTELGVATPWLSVAHARLCPVWLQGFPKEQVNCAVGDDE